MKNLLILCGGSIGKDTKNIIPLKKADGQNKTVIESIFNLFINQNFKIDNYYVVLTQKRFLSSICDECMQIEKKNNIKIHIINLPFETSGPAETAYQAIVKGGIQGELIIKDCDTLISPIHCPSFKNYVIGIDLKTNLSFKDTNVKSSYLKIKGNIIYDIAEKKVISDIVCAGVYSFEDASDFCYAYDFLIASFYRHKFSLYISNIISFLIGIQKCQFNYIQTSTLIDYRDESDKKRLIIVDLDGTLVDTRELNYLSYKEALNEIGLCLNKDDYIRYYGYNYKFFLLQLFGLDDEQVLESVHSRKIKLYSKYISFAKPNEQLINLLSDLSEKYYIVCCTTASRQNTDEMLLFLKLRDIFDYVICQEDVKHLKPNLECYEIAMNMFGCGPSETIIFEDGSIGQKVKKKFKGKVFIV